jgi:hypothetical protein
MALNVTGLLRGGEPHVRDGVRGEAISLTSAASPETTRDMGPDAGYSSSGTYKWWAGATQLIVGVPGSRPVFVNSYRRMTREKYLIPGLRVPVTVSRRDPTRFRIEWDDVPAIDELIARGEALFTDPDATRPALHEALVPAGLAPPVSLPRNEIDGPNARVISFGGAGTAPSPFTRTRRVDVLLSVAIPGEPRFGYRWLGKAPRKLVVRPGANIPVLYDPARPHQVDISWDEIGTTVPMLARAANAIATGIQMPATIRSFSVRAPMANGRTVHLELDVHPADGESYAASIDQALPEAVVGTLAAGQRVTVKVAGDAVMLWNTPHAARGADPDTGRPLPTPDAR